MKTKLFLLPYFFFLFLAIKLHAQATQAVNTISSTSYLGTSNNFDVTFKRQNVFAGILATNKTSLGVNSFATANSVSIGVNAGQFSSGIGSNVYVGQDSGKGAGATPNSGAYNTFIGRSSGLFNTSGSHNTFLGYMAGSSNILGIANIAIGVGAGRNDYGNGNIFIGNDCGCEDGAGGNGNIFIGHGAGFTECGAGNILVIDNAGENYNPLIWGDFANDLVKLNAKVGIGSNFGNYPTTAGGVNVSTYNLFVKGGILTEEIRVSLASIWADYVFAKDYNLKPLAQVEAFIKENGHLPNVPSAKDVKEDGINLAEMAKIQQEKIEELTLYIIEQNKRIEALEAKMSNK